MQKSLFMWYDVGGNLSSAANRQQTRVGKEMIPRVMVNETKKTDKARENSVFPWFLHVFDIFVHLKRTHKQMSEMKKKGTERHCHVNLFIDSFRCQMMFAMSLVPKKGKQSSKSRC